MGVIGFMNAMQDLLGVSYEEISSAYEKFILDELNEYLDPSSAI